MSDTKVPVLIVGGGASGLMTSIMLSCYGIDHILVERHEGTSILPKAHYLNQRAMELFRQFEVADDIYAVGTPTEKMASVVWQTTLAGDGPLQRKTFYKMDCFGGGALTEQYLRDSASRSTNYPQLRLEPIMRQHAEKRAAGRILFHHELTEMSQSDDAVTATIRNRSSGETFTVTADYLVGADGGKTVGQMIGATMVGAHDLLDIVTAHLKADLSQWWEDDVLIAHFINPEAGSYPSGGNMVQMGPTWGKHSEEWAFHFAFLPTDDSDLDEQAISAKIRELLGVGDIPMEILRISHWSVQGSVADKYSQGRVFLVGDAVHRHPPTTGLGMNTCVQDAQNLAWKLAAVLKGVAGPALLDTYAAERQPEGLRIVDWALHTMQNHFVVDSGIGLLPVPVPPEMHRGVFEIFFSDTPMGAARRARFEEVVKTQRVEFQAHDLELGIAYAAGALVPDGSAPPPVDPMGSVYHPTSRPGHRLPHAWLEHAGNRVSTHDLTGNDGRFVLITGARGQAWADAAAAAAERFGVTISVASIGGDYRDVDGQWAEVGEIADDGAILVRPDNFVAWRSTTSAANPADELAGAVGAVLSR
ncbi:2,4-dichlorophenol 6-monooxygenase [Mycolicibacterium chitae]|uniref:FAD-binding monooxygenase n=1 Tax=Mycolicibacterium chitae TaxID=1792 RepID=A0A3S5EIJ5_MYCCI|nr:FAD-dependent monooxygenase [Mycolicibacterium chitae]MCV7104456.1 FAD-dependent monooxygenase [Mycolicibacterium chitae]BBZ05479.1 2,4-dichlorophenol 6-monooxygenase [Mycolicibacterium chitae]VEG49093.1 FAD-binding monooxygenase [Mycolicibacterium chitae]